MIRIACAELLFGLLATQKHNQHENTIRKNHVYPKKDFYRREENNRHWFPIIFQYDNCKYELP